MSSTQREEELAIHLAETLDDMKSLLTYERFVKRYSESHLLEILDIVMKTPKENFWIILNSIQNFKIKLIN